MIEKAKEIISEQTEGFLKSVATANPGQTITATGLAGSLRPFVVGLIAETLSKQILFVTGDEDEAQKLRDDFTLIVGQSRIKLFGGTQHHTHLADATATNVEDVETLRSLLDGNANIVITHALALASSIPNPTSLKQLVFVIESGKEYDFKKLQAQLVEFGF